VRHTTPKGYEFADRVEIKQITKQTANEVYRHHHSYCGPITGPVFNEGSHGIYYRDQLCGAISYNFGLGKCLSLTFTENGITRDQSNGITKNICKGGNIVEVDRICIGVDFPNLASCAFAKSQDTFIRNSRQGPTFDTTTSNVDFLMTFVRIDHTGSMIKALSDKGWELVGVQEPDASASNRDAREINEWGKTRWIRPIGDAHSRVRDCPCPDEKIIEHGKSYFCTNCRAWYGHLGHDWAPNN
jgi:hypothetical protein